MQAKIEVWSAENEKKNIPGAYPFHSEKEMIDFGRSVSYNEDRYGDVAFARRVRQ